MQNAPINAGQKYCRMLQWEHSAILLTFIKLPFAIKIFVLSIFEWLLKTGFTVSVLQPRFIMEANTMNPDQPAPLVSYCLKYRLPKNISRQDSRLVGGGPVTLKTTVSFLKSSAHYSHQLDGNHKQGSYRQVWVKFKDFSRTS